MVRAFFPEPTFDVFGRYRTTLPTLTHGIPRCPDRHRVSVETDSEGAV